MASHSLPWSNVDTWGDKPSTMSVPTGSTADPNKLLENYYWNDKPDGVKLVLTNDYDLSDAKPIWARDPKFGVVLMIFEASPIIWNGIESTVFHFKGTWTRDTLRAEIEKHKADEGSLKKMALEEVLPTE